MSRIFEALRRSEQERNAGGVLPVPDKPQPEREADAAPALNLDGIPRVLCDAPGMERLAGGRSDYSIGAEKFRALVHRLRRLRVDRPLRRILISSAIPKEGKTFVAVNTALTLAASGNRVALVDIDMRQSGLNLLLNLPPAAGLADYLEGRTDLRSAFRILEPSGVYLVAAGQPTTNPVELLQSERMKEFVFAVQHGFDWCVFDAPPLNPVIDAHCVATLADAVLLVVRPGYTPKPALEQALAAAEGFPFAGLVLNASDDSDQQHYYSYYYSRSAVAAAAGKKNGNA